MKFILPILFQLSSCISIDSEIDIVKRDRENLVKNKVRYASAYDIDSLGHKTLRGNFSYDIMGYLTESRFYYDEYLSSIEQYTYNDENIIIEIKEGAKPDSLKVVFKKELDRQSNREIDYEYLENGSVYKSVYTNDSLGRNLYKERYRDSTLLDKFKYSWCGKYICCEIQSFDQEGNISGWLKQNFSNGKLVSSLKYVGKQKIEETSIEYNSRGYKKKVVFKKVDDFINTTFITYKNNLISEELNEYKSLTDNYYQKTKTIWVYERAPKTTHSKTSN